MSTSEQVKCYGTAQEAPPIVVLQAGPLSLELDGGAVRYIRYDGYEAIRGIDYLVRDDSWRTPPAALSIGKCEQGSDSFAVEIDGEVKQDDIHYRYTLVITGTSSQVEITADAAALSGFATNRTGFVVLHPIIGVAGAPVTVTHKDGSTSETTFPELISPGQPIFDIRALRHEVTSGLYCTCRMEAALPYDSQAIYEMEDQRNWTDASYKTYVGSLLDPWPYRIEQGDKISQRILVSFEGRAASKAELGQDQAALAIQQTGGRIPAIGLGLMPQYRAELLARHLAMELTPEFITLYVESDDADLAAQIADYRSIADSLASKTQLELVLPQGKSTRTELDRVAQACAAAGLSPERVIASPRGYLKSIQPVGPWPEVADLGHIYNQCRLAFADAKILGGMLSYFTELNRKRPPIATIDGLSCTTAPIVHAADDRSVMETLEALPAIIASMSAIADGKPMHIGPSSIGMRHNPYGVATAPNPDNERIAMVENDPRQAGLFAAAWTVGYAAAAARSGAIDTLALNHLAGPAGLIGADGKLHPVYHVMKALCAGSNAPRITVQTGNTNVHGLGWQTDASSLLLIANVTPAKQKLRLSTPHSGRALDGHSFDEAADNAGWLDEAPQVFAGSIELDAFASLFLRV